MGEMPYGYGYEDQPGHLAPYAKFNASGAAGSAVGGPYEGVSGTVAAENTISPGDWYRLGVRDGRQNVTTPSVGGVSPTGSNLAEYQRGNAYGKQLHLFLGAARNTG
jgi:hypothetical protein